jgi:hypothetical protein
MRVLLGSVFSGAGCAGASLEPVMASMRQATGLTGLIANTVNIRLSEEFVGVRDFIFLRDEHQRHENVFLERCRIRGMDALSMRTSTNYHGFGVL